MEFFTDAVLCAMERWLLNKECMPPEQFLAKIKVIMEDGAQSICREMAQTEQASS